MSLDSIVFGVDGLGFGLSCGFDLVVLTGACVLEW